MKEQPGLTGDGHGATGAGAAGRHRWRTIVAVLLIVVGCVLAPLAGVAVWARNQVTNTDHRRALVGAAVGVAVAMMGLAVGLAVFRTIYLDALPPQVGPADRQGDPPVGRAAAGRPGPDRVPRPSHPNPL
jgi:hypothetical protein